MTERKVISMGGKSLVLTLPNDLCKKAGITAKTVFDVQLENDKFILTRVKH